MLIAIGQPVGQGGSLRTSSRGNQISIDPAKSKPYTLQNKLLQPQIQASIWLKCSILNVTGAPKELS